MKRFILNNLYTKTKEQVEQRFCTCKNPLVFGSYAMTAASDRLYCCLCDKEIKTPIHPRDDDDDDEDHVPFRNRICVCELPIVSNGALTFDGKLDCKRCGDEWNTAKGSKAKVIHKDDGKPPVRLSRRDYRRLIKRLNECCPCGSGKKYKDCCFGEGGRHDG